MNKQELNTYRDSELERMQYNNYDNVDKRRNLTIKEKILFFAIGMAVMFSILLIFLNLPSC